MSITILILITLYFTANIDCLKYRYDYVYHPEIEGWLKQNNIPATWHQARLRCHLEGAELASPIDDGVLKTLKGRSQVPTWTGVHSLFSKGDYSSIEGVPILRMPISWAPGEPDNHEDKEQCIIMLPNGTFADVCCDEMFPYFCFRKKSASVSVNVACGTVDSRYAYETRTGSCYKFHDHAQTWDRAYMTCEAEGAHLAIMDTAVETQVLKEILSEYPKTKIYGAKYDHVLVGFQDWGDAGVWTTIHDCKRYRYDYVYHPEVEGWLKQNNIPATWHQARLRCHLEGAELASPIDDGFLKTLKGRSQVPTWTGVHSLFSKGDYSSIEGVPILRMPISWAPGEPDNHEDKEQCIIMMANGTFADVCCDEMFPYNCFRKKSASVSVNVACGTVDSSYGYETRTGSCYKFHNHVQTWNRAYMTCAAEGAYLAIMDTAVETQVLKEIISEYPKTKINGAKYDHVLVGFHDWGDAGVWTTIHGQSIDDLVDTGVIRWASAEPNNNTSNGLGQSCGSMRNDGHLYDFWCHIRAAYICEKNPDSLGKKEDEE